MNWTLSTGAAVAAAVIAIALGAVPANAAEDDGVVTWSVKPAQADGADGRAWVERDVDPGETIQEHLAVTNFSDVPVTFALSAADGYFTDKGRFTMLPASEPSRAAGTWVEVQDVVEVAPDETAVVPFLVTVPDNATPGDNAAGIAASVFSSGTDANGTQMGLESRVGFRVMLRVSGALNPSFDVDSASGGFDLSWNPFRPGSASIAYDLVNDGNTTLVITDAVESSGRTSENAVPEGSHELLPGDTRRIEQTVDQVWPIGLVRVVVRADAVSSPGDEDAGSIEREVWVWAVPWPHLLLAAGAALIVAALIWRRRRQRAAVEERIEQVRRETADAMRAEFESVP